MRAEPLHQQLDSKQHDSSMRKLPGMAQLRAGWYRLTSHACPRPCRCQACPASAERSATPSCRPGHGCLDIDAWPPHLLEDRVCHRRHIGVCIRLWQGVHGGLLEPVQGAVGGVVCPVVQRHALQAQADRFETGQAVNGKSRSERCTKVGCQHISYTSPALGW